MDTTCDAVLAPQVFASYTSVQAKIAALDMIDQLQWENLKSSNGGGISFAGFSANGTFDDMKQTLDSYKQSVGYTASTEQSSAILSRTIDKSQVEAWSTCIQSENEGLSAFFVPRLTDDDSTTAILSVAWVRPPGGTDPTVSVSVPEGGSLQAGHDGPITFAGGGRQSADFPIDRAPNASLLKVIVNAVFPDGSSEDVEVGYMWELPALKSFLVCGIFEGATPAPFGTRINTPPAGSSELSAALTPGRKNPCRELAESFGRTGHPSANFRLGFIKADGSIVGGEMNDDGNLPPGAIG